MKKELKALSNEQAVLNRELNSSQRPDIPKTLRKTAVVLTTPEANFVASKVSIRGATK